MKNEILKELEKSGMVEMETNDSILTIRFRKFFGTKKEFHFQLNAKAVDGCKSKPTALRKIQNYINQGFTICES